MIFWLYIIIIIHMSNILKTINRICSIKMCFGWHFFNFVFIYLLFFFSSTRRSGPTAPTRVSAPTGTRFANQACHTPATDVVAAPCAPDRTVTHAMASQFVTGGKGWCASTTITTARPAYVEVGRRRIYVFSI